MESTVRTPWLWARPHFSQESFPMLPPLPRQSGRARPLRLPWLQVSLREAGSLDSKCPVGRGCPLSPLPCRGLPPREGAPESAQGQEASCCPRRLALPSHCSTSSPRDSAEWTAG